MYKDADAAEERAGSPRPRPREADLRAAITGATGFVGSHLVEALAARGDAVAALVRRPEKARALRRDAGWAAEVSLERGLAETARAYREAGLR